jgi:hypothetical protein
MLIGLNRRFIFIANLKSASSAIEQTLKPLSEISLNDSAFGKHLPLAEIEQLFSWLFDLLPLENFLVFGVVRHPVDFMLSLYNSHAHENFRLTLPHLYTGGMSFDRFLEQWCEENSGQLAPQHSRFIAANGAIGANFIISYDRLASGLPYIATLIRAPELLALPRINVSERRLSRRGLTHRQIAWISRRFADDERFIRLYCDRPLTPAERRTWRVSGASAASERQSAA